MAKRMAEQMELFEPVERGFDEGGLMDEGGTVDPVSGNEVPPGSTQEEVRDDIPAQLSEGEFVFPADVVRYIGLENLMRMRQEAKQGLAQMEAMGQMGNSEEATVQDDLPFDMYDLDVEDDGLEMQQGGFVPPVPQPMPQVDPRTGTYQLPGSGISGYLVPPAATTTGYTPYGGAAPVFQPTQFTGAQFQTATEATNLPTFAQTVGGGAGYDELRTYINDAGQTLQIPFKDGKPIYPIPEGYRPIGDQDKPKDQPTTVTPTTGQTQVRDEGGKDNITDTTPTTSTTLGKVGTSLFGPSTVYNKAKAKLGMNQFGSMSAIASLGATVLGLAEPKTKSIMGNVARDTAINNFGFDSLDNATPQQLDAIGYTMEAAMNLSVQNTSLLEALKSKTGLKAGAPTAATVSKAAASIADSLIGAYKDGDLSLKDLKNISEVEIDEETGSWKDPKAVKDYVNAVLSQELKDIEQGLVGTSKESGLTAQEKRDRRSEEIRDEIDKGTYGVDPSDPADKGASVDIGGGQTSTGAAGTGGLGPGGMGGTDSRDDGRSSQGFGGTDSPSGGSSCFAAGTKFFMEDGSLKNIEDIKIGDVLQKGGKVRTTIVGDGLYEEWYMYGNTKVTGTHTVFENGTWKRIADSDKATPTEKDEFIYTLVNEKHRLIAEDGVMYGDYDEVDNLDIEDGLLEMMNLQDSVDQAA